MNLTVDRREFAAAVAHASMAVRASTPTPVLASIRMDVDPPAATLSAFDYETASRATLVAAADMSGSRLLPGILLTQLAKALRGDQVTVSSDSGTTTVDDGHTRYRLPQIPLDSYPELPPTPPEVGTVDAADLGRMLTDLAASEGKNQMQPALLGCQLIFGETIRAMSSDRYRATVTETPWQSTGVDATVHAPPALLDLARRLTGDTVGIHADDATLAVVDGSRSTTMRLIADEFVVAENITKLAAEKYPMTARVDTGELLGAVKRVALVLDPKSPVHLDLSPGEVTVHAAAESDARESIPCDTETQLNLIVNATYLQETLAVCGETVSFSCQNERKPMRWASDTATHYLMPIRT